jgi:hypothetical protein
MQTILFLKARVGPYLRRGKWVSGYEGRASRVETPAGQRDMFKQPPNPFKGVDPVAATPDLFEGQVPPKQDLPTVEHDGDTWYIVSTGAVGADGRVMAHLSSATRMQGSMPKKVVAWITPPGRAGELAKAILLMRAA